MSASQKLKISSASEKSKIKAGLLGLANVKWQEKGEQYCDYRLDGTSPEGWLRVKQYTNGTLYIEASTSSLMGQLSGFIPGISATDNGAASGAGKAVSAKASGKLDISGAYIGTDESGKGDFFGSLVIAGVYVTEETMPILMELGVMDSKKLTDKIMAGLALDITQVVGEDAISCIELAPKRYNELYQEFKSGGKNLNHLLAWGHATAIENLLVLNPECTQAVADQFGNERYILSQMKEKGKQINLYQTPRAEANVGVAAASIIARTKFVQRMERMSQDFGMPLSKGANPIVKNQARAFVDKFGKNRLNEIAKLHFKTANEL